MRFSMRRVLKSMSGHIQSSRESDDSNGRVSEIDVRMQALESFIARRFDEISAEINATSQLVGMAEDGMARKFGEILQILHAISHHGDGTSPVSAGVELDAVIGITEQAANDILDAAGRIATRLHDTQGWDNPQERGKMLDRINKDVEDILVACTFQDLTSQRVRKTLENLRAVESRLSNILEKVGVHVTDTAQISDITEALKKGIVRSQGEIDDLLRERRQ